MGCPPGAHGTDGIGDLAFPPCSSHQPTRTTCSSIRTSSVSLRSATSVGDGVDRQLHSRRLHSTSGRHSFPPSVPRDRLASPLVCSVSGLPSSTTSAGPSQHLSRPPVTSRCSPSGRVDTQPTGSPQPVSSAGPTISRPVCISTQSPTSTVRVSHARSQRRRSRRHGHGLGRHSRLCVSPVSHGRRGSSEVTPVKRATTPHRAIVATSRMVHRSSTASGRSASISSRHRRPAISVQRPRPVPQSGHSTPTRLAVIREFLREKRFSTQATAFIAKSRRASTSAVYDAKWTVYVRWCESREIDPLSPSIPQLADFLVFLFADKKLSPSTIKGYRSMLSHTLHHSGNTRRIRIGTDSTLSDLIRSFELERPRSRSLAPKWDLACVLLALTKEPFEPLSIASLLHLSWKTSFLLAFASAKRCSELHALSVEEGHCRFNRDGSVSLSFQPGFLAKTQLPSIAAEPICIPSLAATCGSSDPDRFLCPVRALKIYLRRVAGHRGNRRRLFIPVRGQGDISKASISRWIASVIRKAYSDLSPASLRLLQISAHEVRALSTSWAFLNRTSLEDILQAAFWKAPSTFSSFYLRSFAQQTDNIFALGPLLQPRESYLVSRPPSEFYEV